MRRTSLKIGNSLVIPQVPKPISMQNWTSRQIYRAIVPPPWIRSHGNLLWHMRKSMRWWKMVLSINWKSKFPLKQRVFLWRCMLGILPVGKILASHRIASSSCRRCSNRMESIPRLLWFCPDSRDFLLVLSRQLRSRFPFAAFGKFFWVFGKLTLQLHPHAIFMHWVRFWAFSSIWSKRNVTFFESRQFQLYAHFRGSLWQSLFDCCRLKDIDITTLTLFYNCF
ncbi:hypothetical protein L7F22_038437 [Adiantum nelumboides]|nr:hypothetical protein [Adiantum nelumboides]